MNVETFILPLTVNGKKIKASGSKFKPMKEILYRVSIPWEKWHKVFVFMQINPATREFHCYKHNESKIDAIEEIILAKLKTSKI